MNNHRFQIFTAGVAVLCLWIVGCASLQRGASVAKVEPLVIEERPIPTKKPRVPGSVPADRTTNMRPPRASEVLPSGAKSFSAIPVDTAFPSLKWFPQGPGPTTNADANMPPDHPSVGAVQTVVPHFSNSNIVYLATVNGGVWKTTNAYSGAYHWRPLTDQLPSLSCGAMMMDPADPTGNTLLVAVGRRSSFGGNSGGALIGVLRSTDGGENWTILNPTNALSDRNLNSIVARGNLIMVGTDGGPTTGLFRSTDTGAGFTRISGAPGSGLPAGSVTHIVADSENTSRYYAHVSGVGVYRSTDSGATWTSINQGIAALAAGNVALAVHGRLGTSVVYAATIPGRLNPSLVYRSTNAGSNWTAMDNIVANAAGSHHSFVAHPVNPNLIYIAGEYTRANFPFSEFVARGDASKAAGAQWTPVVDLDGFGGSLGNAPHTDSRSMAFDVAGNLYEGNDGGVYRLASPQTSTNGVLPGGGFAWTSLNAGLLITENHHGAYDRVTDTLLAGTQDNGSPSQTRKRSVIWKKDANGDASDVGVEYSTSPGNSVRYYSSQFLLGLGRETRDSNNVVIGLAFPPLTPVGGSPPFSGQFVTPFGVNRVFPQRLILGGANGIYETIDQCNTITLINGSVINSLSRVANGGRIGTSTNSGVLYACSGNNVLVRTNVANAVATTPVAFPGGQAESVVMHESDWRIAYVISPTNVWVTTNAGNGWANLTGNLIGVGTFNSIDFVNLPGGPDCIAVGADCGVYLMRLSAPGVWRRIGGNLPNAPVYDLWYDPVDNVLAAALFGRGMWTFNFTPPTFVVTSLADSGTNTLREAMEWLNLQGAATITFGVNGTINLASPLPVVTGSATILGPGTNQLTINGGGAHDIFAFIGGTTNRVSGLRLVNAFSVNHGAALRSSGHTALENCVISNSVTLQSLGGAVCSSFGGSLFATNCVFVNNTVRGGEGESRSELSTSGGGGGGGAGMGGAVFSDGPQLVLHNCAFIRNMAAGGNGGLGGGNQSGDPRGGHGGYPNRGDGGAALAVPGGNGGFGGGAGGGGRVAPGGTGGYGGGGGGGGANTGGGTGGAGGAAGQYGGAGGTAQFSFAGGGGGGAGLGGGVFVGGGFATLVNCSFIGNIASNGFGGYGSFGSGSGANGQGAGGAVFSSGGSVCYSNVTFNGNIATTSLPDTDLSTLVTTANEGGPGSLRQAIYNANLRAGDDAISFAVGLSNLIVRLTSGELPIFPSGTLTLNGAAVPGGLTISGEGLSRVFRVFPGATAILESLTITNGNAIGDQGGGLFNEGNTTVRRSTFVGNQAGFHGGAIRNLSSVTLENCTLVKNSAGNNGGGIQNDGGPTLVVRHCTIVSNTAAIFGGGLRHFNGTMIVSNSLIAHNVDNGTGPDVAANTPLSSSVFNLLRDGTGSGLTNGVNGNIVGTAGSPIEPRVGPLQNNGGLTQTMAPLGGSPAINAGDPLFNGFGLTDQRSFPRVSNGRVDVGAVEIGLRAYYTFDNFTVSDAFGSSIATYQGSPSGPWWNSDHRGQGVSSIALNDPGFGTDNRYLITTPHDPTNANRGLGLKGDFTVSMWIYPRLLGGWKVLLGNTGPGGSGTLVLGLFDQNVRFAFWNNDVNGGRTVSADQWTHVACTYNSHGGQMALYVNGLLDVSAVGRANTLGNHNLLLGFCEGLANSYFQGFIDEFAIFNEALSASQISALANPSGIFPNTILPQPVLSPGLAAATCGWNVREIHSHTGDPAIMPYDLPTAEHVANTPHLAQVTNYNSSVINRFDPDTNGDPAGFRGRDIPFASNNRTPQGLINGDDNNFVLAARTTIQIVTEDDYTFGFASDDGARLRIKGAVFTSSTQLGPGNPATPAHRGDTLSFPDNTGDSRTLGVTHLKPGNYEVEFIMWELGGGAWAEVLAARGARASVDSSFALLSPLLFTTNRPGISISRAVPSSNVRLNWNASSCYRLQSASNVLGPWSEVANGTNGVIITPGGAAQFYRLSE